MRVVAQYCLVQLNNNADFFFFAMACVFLLFLYNVCAMVVHSDEYRKPEGTNNDFSCFVFTWSQYSFVFCIHHKKKKLTHYKKQCWQFKPRSQNSCILCVLIFMKLISDFKETNVSCLILLKVTFLFAEEKLVQSFLFSFLYCVCVWVSKCLWRGRIFLLPFVFLTKYLTIP